MQPIESSEGSEIAVDRGAGDELPFYCVSATKLAILSFATLGLYELFWFYKNWALIRARTGRDISPFWSAFFSILLMRFRGFAELGLVAGVGVLLCLAAATITLPALLVVYGRFRRRRDGDRAQSNEENQEAGHGCAATRTVVPSVGRGQSFRGRPPPPSHAWGSFPVAAARGGLLLGGYP